MFYEKTHVLDVNKSMYKYPWLEYPERAKEFRKATTLAHLPLSCYQMPKEEFPPSPECWRQHPSKPHSVPYCYSQKPEIYSHWHTLYGRREEREVQKMLQKMRDHPRYLKQSIQLQKLHLPINKLTPKSQVDSTFSGPTSDPLKWQRLKELTQSLESPREDEQHYAAQALGCLGISDKFIIEALRKVAKTGPEKVKFEAFRTLALLGCLNKQVIQALMHHLKGRNEARRTETLVGLRTALNNWVTVPKDKRTQVGDEGKLVPLLQMLMKALPNDMALEAALCLGFLRPCSQVVQEFLLQYLGQGPKIQQMKALTMLVSVMHVHSATVIKAILEQLCSSSVLEHRLEAAKMLRTIGLEKIQAQGLEGLTFDLLRKKLYNEPFLAMRQAVAETVEELKMKPMMMNLVEAQLMSPSATTRQEAVTSLGILGIRSPQVYHLLLDMLDSEKSQDMKKSLQKTLILLASTDPWIRKKLKNKVLFVYEAPKLSAEPEPTRFRKEPESPEELNIQDFRLAQLSPLFVAKSSPRMDQQKKPAFPSCFSNPVKDMSQAKKPWEPRIRRQLQTLAKTSK
ncbi:protein HEATR9 [Orycteropus afer afer]|uniref:Protein HEATR9 n=1 Tax=Orycteropus afer afer TaxID=1230840 RepID=A0A8B7AF40_ORYAF|nr:protein HEATR9 [Orycteropus afer afer]